MRIYGKTSYGTTSNIGSFLDSVNARRGAVTKAGDMTDLEAAAKSLLAILGETPVPIGALQQKLQLPAEMFEPAKERLLEVGMARVCGKQPNDQTIALTDFAIDAMKVFHFS